MHTFTGRIIRRKTATHFCWKCSISPFPVFLGSGVDRKIVFRDGVEFHRGLHILQAHEFHALGLQSQNAFRYPSPEERVGWLICEIMTSPSCAPAMRRSTVCWQARAHVTVQRITGDLVAHAGGKLHRIGGIARRCIAISKRLWHALGGNRFRTAFDFLCARHRESQRS